MARTILKTKTALIYGADCPAGRAVALQLSREGARVVIAGYDQRRLQLLKDLIVTKGGDPHLAVLTPDEDRVLTILREARELMGNHYHLLINCMAAVEGPVDNPDEPIEIGRHAYDLLMQLVSNRGAVRLATLWPDDAGAPPKVDKKLWHCLIRTKKVEMSRDEVLGSIPADMVKAGGAADAIVFLLSCPPSACPVEVRLEPRNLKV